MISKATEFENEEDFFKHLESIGINQTAIESVQTAISEASKQSARIKVLYRKKLNMSAGKLSAQVAHAVLKLAEQQTVTWMMPVVVLGVNEAPFQKMKSESGVVTIRDAGFTEIPAGTETVLAFVEELNQGENENAMHGEVIGNIHEKQGE